MPVAGRFAAHHIADMVLRLNLVRGRVTLSQLFATWVTGDLDQIVQISRVMDRKHAEAVGPRRENLRIIRETPGAG